jgi:hypothetical protein
LGSPQPVCAAQCPSAAPAIIMLSKLTLTFNEGERMRRELTFATAATNFFFKKLTFAVLTKSGVNRPIFGLFSPVSFQVRFSQNDPCFAI